MKVTEQKIRSLVRQILLEDERSQTRKYKGKTYTASPGSISALKKHDMDASKAVDAGDFDWADEPYAAAQAALIVATGKTTGEK